MMPEKSQPKRKGNHAARRAAIQALYQIEQAGKPADEIINEFLTYRLHIDPEQETDLKVNKKLFEEIVRTTSHNQDKIDGFIRESLPENWSLERIDSVLRAILRAGCGEFLMDKKLAAAVIINEYMNVTREFFYNREPGFVNGILDHIAHMLGLKMKDQQESQVKDYTKEYNTSGIPNWEDEGGAS